MNTAKTWYLDGTFKIVKPPFVQLWSIHAFIVKGEESKQVPLAYIFMSSRKATDYVAVFNFLKALIPDMAVECMVMDFEAALWKAIRKVFPAVKCRGCCFHWTQAVWRKIQEVGLQVAYNKEVAVHHLCKHLLGLPFVPEGHIEPCFIELQKRAETDKLKVLFKYVNKTWIRSSIWGPGTWSCYGQSIRTNNDVEGWHHRLNAKAATNSLPFYKLLGLLHKESEIVTVHLLLMTESNLRRHQRTKYKDRQGKIFTAWQRYYAKKITVTDLLDQVGQVYKPTE